MVIAVALGLTAAAQSPGAAMPAMAEWVEAALEAHPGMATQAAAIQAARGRAEVARSASLPSLRVDLNAGFEQQFRANGDGSDRVVLEAIATARQPLYQWGGLAARRELGALDVEERRLDYRLRERDLRRVLRALWLDRWVAEQRLKVAQAARVLAAERLAEVEGQAQRGEASEDALLSAQIEARQAALELQQAERAQQGLAEQMAQLLPDFEPNLPPELPEPPAPVADAPERLAEAQTELQLERSEAAETIARAQLRPQLDFVIRAWRGEENFADENNVTTWNFFGGLGMRWAIFDGFATRGQIREQQARQRQLKADLAASRLETTARERQRADALDLLASERELASLRLQQAERRLLQARDALEDGTGSTRALDQARLNRDQARLDLNNLRAQTWLLLATPPN